MYFLVAPPATDKVDSVELGLARVAPLHFDTPRRCACEGLVDKNLDSTWLQSRTRRMALPILVAVVFILDVIIDVLSVSSRKSRDE